MPQYIITYPASITASHVGATKPVPTNVADGVDIAGWFNVSPEMCFPMGIVFLMSDVDSVLTGPSIIYGFSPSVYVPGPPPVPGFGRWFEIGVLKGGANINLTANVGYAEQFNFPGVFTRLAISTSIDAGNIDDRYMPITSNI